MKITNALLLLSFFLYVHAQAQNPYSVKGSIVDSVLNTRLTNATVSVLNAKDSTLLKFVFVKEGGGFIIPNLKAGDFILLVSYPAYADYVEVFKLDAMHPLHNFNAINMQLKSRLLHNVVIKGTVNAIKIKGDTTEFNAKAYVNQPNDKVENLLKQLPGIQIDKDGKITANGQAVNKVLVDGEEFFGDDPTLVTKNLRADMVDKVQLYDKKSDQATFTGIDDGQKTKTINIKLKEDKKNGVFGKLDGGIGTQDRYEGQAIYNRFQTKQKYSAYATSANDGKTGLGFADNNTLGASGSNVVFSDDGNISITNSSKDVLDSYSGAYDGRGKPIAHSGGLHFDNKWGAADKYTFNTNYKTGFINVTGLNATITQQNLSKDSLINTNADQKFNSSAFRQKLDGTFLIKLDTASTLKLSADGTFRNFKVNDVYKTTSQNGSGNLINRNNRSIKNDGDQQAGNVSALYTKKFKKAGRTLSWNVSEAYNDNNTKGYLNSEVDFYNDTTGSPNGIQSINQYKTTDALSSVLNSNITYSEPFSKTVAMLFNYGVGLSNSNSNNRSFNQSPSGVYNKLDSVYSNNYRFNQTTNQIGAIFNYKTKKITFNFGAKASDVDYKQTDEYTDDVYRRSYVNLAPQASFKYSPSSQRSLSVSYSGTTTQPNINQLQPVNVNTDPLNVVIGNANLKPFSTNNFNLDYNSAKVLSGSESYVSVFVLTRNNSIVNHITTDPVSGKTTTRYVNLNNNTPWRYMAYAGHSFKIKPLEVSLSIDANSIANINYNYINSALNRSKSVSYTASVSLNKNVERKYFIYVSAGPNYVVNEFSLQPQNNNNSAGFNSSFSGTYFLLKSLTVSSDVNYNYDAKTIAFDEQYRTIWNASFSKTFFKDENLVLSINAYNLLNQNVNFSRRILANSIIQTNTNGIGRYFMLTVAWNFTKFKMESAENKP